MALKMFGMISTLVFNFSFAQANPTNCGELALDEARLQLSSKSFSEEKFTLKEELVDWNYYPCQSQEESLGCGYETWDVFVFEKEEKSAKPWQILTFDFEMKENLCISQKE